GCGAARPRRFRRAQTLVLRRAPAGTEHTPRARIDRQASALAAAPADPRDGSLPGRALGARRLPRARPSRSAALCCALEPSRAQLRRRSGRAVGGWQIGRFLIAVSLEVELGPQRAEHAVGLMVLRDAAAD